MHKLIITLVLANVLGLGGLLVYKNNSSDLSVIASNTDPALIAAKCSDYALKNPTKPLPKVCTDLGSGSTTPIPQPTAVPGTVVATATPAPGGNSGGSATPTPGSTTPQPGEPYSSAPLCPAHVHDKRVFHTLWNAGLGCHYDHHHGDNPHELDGVLTEDLFTKMGGEISYPWQTFSTSGLENDLKHGGYFWHVRSNIPCTKGSPCITDFRTLVHQHPTGLDATIRYHSYVFEARTSDGGYFLLGGWADFGDLHSPEGTVVVDVIGNHDSKLGLGAGRHKQHSPDNGSIIWYGASQTRVDENYPRGFLTLSTTIQDAWDYTDPDDPGRSDDYVCHGLVPAERCRINATTLRPHLISINMIRDFNSILQVTDGVANFSGFADRYGRPLAANSGCTGYTVDCAPMIIRGLRSGFNYQTADSHTALSFKDYDFYFNNRSSGWNQPVN